MKIGIDIRLIGKKQTGSEAVFFNLTKNLAIIDQENEYKLFTDITDKNQIEKIKKDLEIIDKNNFEIINGDYCCELLFKNDNSVKRTDSFNNKTIEEA